MCPLTFFPLKQKSQDQSADPIYHCNMQREGQSDGFARCLLYENVYFVKIIAFSGT